jgi:ABC-2 type transport system ATP-binding protein
VYVEPGPRRITAPADGLDDMTRIGRLLGDHGFAVDDLGLKRPSLDDVFLHLTGHRAESEDPDDSTSDPESVLR